jgi:MoaA/NifB/PqqE/SkfB family radical SAM enzyme
MMRKDIPRLIRRIRFHRIECLLNSNGFQIPERIRELNGLSLMSISLDGPREINDAYRGEGAYDQALRALAAARAHGIPVQILMTLTGRFQEAYRHVLNLAEEYDCFIGMNILRPRLSVDGREGMSVENYTQQARDFLDYLLRHRSARLPYPPWLLKRFRDWPEDYDRCYIPRGESLGSLPEFPCISGRFMITIDPSGDLFGCARHCYRNPLANCADGDVARAWENLEAAPCRACLDFGWTLLNGACSFRPSFLFGLLKVMAGRDRKAAGASGD